MKQITFSDGIIRLGGVELPGILETLSIDGKVRYDEQKVDGMSGKSKTPQGWEDHSLMASLTLITDNVSDCYEKLEQLTPFFQMPDEKANPQIYSFTNRHALARGVRTVIFDRLESSENDQGDIISVTIAFKEHKPPVIRTEKNAAKTKSAKELAKEGVKGEQAPKDDAGINNAQINSYSKK